MLVSIDIKALREHNLILKKELKATYSLIDSLNSWCNELLQQGTTDTSFVDYHLKIAQNELEYIRRRISLLESMADDFSDVKHYVNDCLETAAHIGK